MLEEALVLLQVTIYHNDTDIDQKQSEKKMSQQKVRQKKLKVENFLTKINCQFNHPQMSKTELTKFQIFVIANPGPIFTGAGRGPTRGNQNQNTNQHNIHQCGKY